MGYFTCHENSPIKKITLTTSISIKSKIYLDKS